MTARLTRTAEHAARARDAYDQVLYREKTANEQKVALQNQLALEMVEREKRVKTVDESEAKVRRELATLESNAAADVDAFAADARETDAAALPHLFRGSSPGAVSYGTLALRLDGE